MVIQHKPSSGMMTAGLGESGVVRYDDASNRSHYAGGRRGSFSPMTHALPDLSLPPDDYKVINHLTILLLQSSSIIYFHISYTFFKLF